ncbi:MopE-related protein [Desulfopila aestuarii]|uniref:Major paralogous domain-containing protein n=1 Tax=Desulfopila aestuarii DSM 18488 TaxID=1121416 RepID=A0A1M7YK63_9BACT|nr:MopE-related protein [Desulfopila aestuarii]SHO52966.1 major paralogous domain-containing protein [Desulfopila aestuarii DSM 18488]
MKELISRHWPAMFYMFILLLIAPIDASAETDITDKIQQNSTRMLFNRQTNENYFDVSLTNKSAEVFLTPITVVIDSISTDAVTVSNPDGYTDNGKPYFKYVDVVNGVNNEFDVSQTTTNKKWSFLNPSRLRFTYAVKIFGSEKALSIIEAPSTESTIEYDLGGENNFQLITRKYTGSIKMPNGYNPNKFFINSGIAGQTSISSDGLFVAEMNSDATTLLEVIDSNGSSYLLKVFAKSNEIREVNPEINAKSTAISMIAIQSGILTTKPMIDAMVLALIESLPETEILASEIEKELENGTFKLSDSHLSTSILEKCADANKALSSMNITDIANFNYFKKIELNIGKVIDAFIPNANAEWIGFNCFDVNTLYLYDSDNIDRDGICFSGDIKQSGYDSILSAKNRLGRWSVFGVNNQEGFNAIDWVEPRNISFPGADDILQEILKLGFQGAPSFFKKIFTDQDDQRLFIDRLTDILSSYFGNGYVSSTYHFDQPGIYKISTVGAHLKDFSTSPNQFEIFQSLTMSIASELIAPMASIVTEIDKEKITHSLRYSVKTDVCREQFKNFLTPSIPQITNTYNKFITEGYISAFKSFFTDYLADNFLSADLTDPGVILLGCTLKNVFNPNIVDFVREKIDKYFVTLGFGVYIDAYNNGVVIFNALYSGSATLSHILSDDYSSNDEYTLTISSSIDNKIFAPNNLSPTIDLIIDYSKNHSFTLTDNINIESIKHCLVINNRGIDMLDKSDDYNVYDTCNISKPEYYLTQNKEFTLPAYTLNPDSHYTWAVYAIDDINNLMSESSEWWNFSTSSLNPTCTDNDQDGYYVEINCSTTIDCNDADPEISPSEDEICSDSVDNNCDGQINEGCNSPFEFETVTSNTGQVWMDRNLGASRVATSPTDTEAYGDLYQWGRGTDGHEKRDSGTTSTLSSSDTPGHSNFISSPNAPYDWRSPQNDSLWQGVSGINNPCPAGFRLPTETELNTERIYWTSNDAVGAFESPLKLTVAGQRLLFSYSLPIAGAGSSGDYWSGTVDGSQSRALGMDSGYALMYTTARGHGLSVRCIQDYEPDEIQTVTSTTGQVWMDRNLGASRAATSPTDSEAYGDLYQWGRGTDGHEKRGSGTTSTLSSSDTPGHSNFILSPNTPFDWRSPQNDSLWQGVSGINNPCPSGFRLPTETELKTEIASWTSDDASGAYSSPLKFVIAGGRSYNTGIDYGDGSYWSGTVDRALSRYMFLHRNSVEMYSFARAHGFSVRCIQDYEPEKIQTVTSAGQIWMDRNLGASRVATSPTDTEAYGDLYQWGRGRDGHEKRDSGITSIPSSSDTPNHSNFITPTTEPYDWRTPQNNNLWQGVNGINNPCPSGFRLPTITELETERTSWSSNDLVGAYGSPLKLVAAGYRPSYFGGLSLAGRYGIYWSDSMDGFSSQYLGIVSNDAGVHSGDRANGVSVRCLKD